MWQAQYGTHGQNAGGVDRLGYALLLLGVAQRDRAGIDGARRGQGAHQVGSLGEGPVVEAELRVAASAVVAFGGAQHLLEAARLAEGVAAFEQGDQGVGPQDLGALKLTIARWLTPDKHWINGVGIVPDVAVELPDNLPAGDDPVLDKAVELLGAAG